MRRRALKKGGVKGGRAGQAKACDAACRRLPPPEGFELF